MSGLIHTAPTPGLHPNIPHEIYHADPCPMPSLSASIAKRLIADSPLHAWNAHPRLGNGEREESTTAQDNGTLIDRLIFDSGPAIVEVNADNWRTKAAQEQRDAALEAGHIPVLTRVLAEALITATKVVNRLGERGIKLSGQSQVTAIWQKNDIWCRGRFDHWVEKTATIYDLKWVKSAHPDDIAKHMVTYGVDIQSAAYVEAVETLRPELAGRVKFQPLFIENGPVLAMCIRPIAGTMRELGQRKWHRACEKWARCLATNDWPDYGDNGQIEAPEWALTADMNQQLAAMENSNATAPF